MPQFSKYEMHFYIHGKGGKSAEGGELNSEATQKATEPKEMTAKEAIRKVAGFYAGTSLVRTAVKTGVGLMDVYTGNDYQERVISGVISAGESVIGLALATAINPVAGATMLAGKAISMGAEAERNKKDIYVQGLSAELVRDRAGGAFNRSRINGRY